MIYKTLVTTILAILLSIWLSNIAFADSIVIDNTVVYAKDAEVRQAVKDECDLEQKFTDFLDEYISDQGITVVKADSEKAKSITKRLHIEIDRVFGQGGGAFGAFKGTCSILGRDVKAMAKNISRWITSPTKNTRLGEL